MSNMYIDEMDYIMSEEEKKILFSPDQHPKIIKIISSELEISEDEAKILFQENLKILRFLYQVYEPGFYEEKILNILSTGPATQEEIDKKIKDQVFTQRCFFLGPKFVCTYMEKFNSFSEEQKNEERQKYSSFFSWWDKDKKYENITFNEWFDEEGNIKEKYEMNEDKA